MSKKKHNFHQQNAKFANKNKREKKFAKRKLNNKLNYIIVLIKIVKYEQIFN